MQIRRVVILGSTGSIGRQTLEVVAHINQLADRGESDLRFEVAGLAAGNNASLLAEQARRFGVSRIAIKGDPDGHAELHGAIRGEEGPEQLVRSVDADMVVAAMVGVAGLPATLAAIDRGIDVALANKETLVAAGHLVTRTIATRPGRRVGILPVDSEHAGLWQCLMGAMPRHNDPATPPLKVCGHIGGITLTASGGPFRSWTREAISRATPPQALKHPIWLMGGKVTIDSASLMNKCLELIEAYWLFGIDPARLNAVIHPQSIVHALVETADGSAIAQLGTPDMRTPIQMALTHPRRAGGLAKQLRLDELSTLTFEPVDKSRFPAMTFWKECVGEAGSTTRGAILNAANEEAVIRFLDSSREPLAFGRITDAVGETLAMVQVRSAETLSDILQSDQEARLFARSLLNRA